MGNRWTWVALAAAAAAVAGILAADVISGGERPTRRILPGLDPDAVVAIEIERPGEGGDEPVRLERGPAGRMRLTAPIRAPADPQVVADMLSTLELLSYQRRGGGPPADGSAASPRAVVRVIEEGGGSREIALGAEVEVSGQAWVAEGGEPFLVRAHMARALDRRAADLRERRPLRAAVGLRSLELRARGAPPVQVDARPPARVVLPGGPARADAAAVRAVIERARDIAIDRFADGAPPGTARGAPRLVVRALGEVGARVEVFGACPDGGVFVDTSAGAGCASGAQVRELEARARAPGALVDRRLVAGDRGRVTRLAISRGDRRVEVEGETRLSADGGDAGPVDASRVRAWIRAFAGAAEGAPVTPAQPPEPVARVELGYERGPDDAIAVGRAGGELLARRDGEPLWLPLGADAERLVRADPLAFRELALVARDAHAVRSLSRRRGGRLRERVVRGELAGEVVAAAPAGARPRPAAASRARAEVASLRASRFAAAAPASQHGLSPPRFTVEAALDPPPVRGGEPERHVIEVGAPAAGGGCYVRVDGGPVAVILEPACGALAGPWTR